MGENTVVTELIIAYYMGENMDHELLMVAGAGILGLIGAGYINTYVNTASGGNAQTYAVMQAVIGSGAIAVPLLWYKSNEGWGGVIRVFLVVAGIVLAANGFLNLFGLQSTVGPITMNIL